MRYPMELYFHVNDQQVGPYTIDQLRELLTNGQILQETLAWHDGLTEWVPVIALLPSLPDPSAKLVVPPPAPIQSSQKQNEVPPANRGSSTSLPPMPQYYIHTNGHSYGPLNVLAINQALQTGQIASSDMACALGNSSWVSVNHIQGIVLPMGQAISQIIPLGSNLGKTVAIDTMNISQSWKARFRLLEGIGWDYNNYWSNYGRGKPAGKLSYSERLTIFFSIWGILFGPFYYFYLGMWKKGLIIALVALLVAMTGIGLIIAPAYCCGFAVLDYYAFKKRGN
jgi:hypothetical protein